MPILLIALAHAAAPPSEVTVDDLHTVASVGEIAATTDGRTIVWTEWRWDAERDVQRSDLWVYDGAARRLTFDAANDRSPVISEDGKTVYYLTSRAGGDHPPDDGTSQVYRLRLKTGEIQPVTSAPDGVSQFRVHGNAVYYTVSHERYDEDAFTSLRETHSGPDYGGVRRNTHTLHRLDLDTWRTEDLLGGDRAIEEFAVSPDGETIALLSRPDDALIWNEGWSDVQLLFPETGELTTLDDTRFRAEAPSPYGWLLGLAFSDAGQLAFRIDFDGYPGELFVTDGSNVTRVPRSGEFTLSGGDIVWQGGEICHKAHHRATLRVQCLTPEGDLRVITEGDRSVWDYAFTKRGILTYEAGADSLGEVFLTKGNKRSQLSDLNPQVANWKLPQRRRFTWTAPDTTTVEGVLELPYDYLDEMGPLPTIVYLHGGPTWAEQHTLSTRRIPYTGAGYAVFAPNYRGSTGYGDAFLEQLIGRENDIEVADILAGVDALVAAGIADPDQLVVMGWSNGGYLTNCLISKTDRFKAASSGAGVFDQTLQWAMEDTPGHVINYMAGLPWEQQEAVFNASPLYAADKIVTPTLIHVGQYDARVPAAHARALFRALRFYVGTDTELLVYPGEGHGLSRWSHRSAKAAWDLAWFDRYLRPPSEDLEEEG